MELTREEEIFICRFKNELTEAFTQIVEAFNKAVKIVIKALKKFIRFWNKNFKRIKAVDAVEVISAFTDDKGFHVDFKIKKYHYEWIKK